ncbi:hypothetical protein CASFOL_026284 [Castilleja foliolosa]|uniref:Uncharacterized protein n=1 Tax=Castilleja foliolosa TaxID=1961234 RepID=A0ABD3CN03_9LAMI
MEWYSSTVTEDFSVPNGEEIFDKLPSPNSWPSWGKLAGTFNSQSVYPDELSDMQIDDDLSVSDEADDIFFRSIFKAGTPTIDEYACPADFTQISSMDDTEESSNSFQNTGRLPQATEPELEIHISEEPFNGPEVDMLEEESVLLDLQISTLQLSKKSRICFRDSFYRLAENSRNQAECTRNGKDNLETCKPSTTNSGPFRSLESEAEISENNAIDRTVATLLFSTMECCNLDTETQTSTDHDSISIYAVPGGDAEVPTFGLTNQITPSKKITDCGW